MTHSHSYYQQIPYTKYFKRQKQPFVDDLKIDALKRFCNIFRKTPVLESLFNNVACLKVHNFIRKGLHHMCFLVKNIAKFLENTFSAFKEHLFWKWVTELLNFFYLNVYELFKFSTVRNISQCGNRWAIHLHYISITQLAGKESSTT